MTYRKLDIKPNTTMSAIVSSHVKLYSNNEGDVRQEGNNNNTTTHDNNVGKLGKIVRKKGRQKRSVKMHVG